MNNRDPWLEERVECSSMIEKDMHTSFCYGGFE